MRYFEDFEPGQVFQLGSREMKREEMIAFAREYDPQPFHLGDEGPYGGLIASGWQTIAIGSRLMVDAVLRDSAALGSPGFDELRWLAPVRPGDVLSAQATVVETTPSGRDPRRGTVYWLFETTNQDRVVVLRMKARMFFARRPAGA